MKTLKALFAVALICSTVALPLRAQDKSLDKDKQPPHKQSTPPPPVQPAPDATPMSSTIALKESTTYTEKREYLLGPSDVIELKVYNDPQFNGDLEVDPDGNVIVPFLEQPIHAQCRSVKALSNDVKVALGKFLKEPRVYMRTKEQHSHKAVYIYGAVRAPSTWEMQRPVRLLELVSRSGGVTEQHSGTIQIMHTEPPQCPDVEPVQAAPIDSAFDPLGLPFSIYKVDDLKQGKPEANPYLRPGDIINVAEAPPVMDSSGPTSRSGGPVMSTRWRPRSCSWPARGRRTSPAARSSPWYGGHVPGFCLRCASASSSRARRDLAGPRCAWVADRTIVSASMTPC